MNIIVDDGGIVNDRGLVDDRHIPRFIDIIVAYIRAGNILVRYKTPVMRRRIVTTAIGVIDIHTRFHRSPAVIIVTVPPGHPGRSPFITRDPHPAIAV